MDKLIFLIKYGKLNENHTIVDLFGNQTSYLRHVPVKYTLVKQYASKLGLTNEELDDLILKHAKADLLLEAIICTQNFETFADAWLKKARGSHQENIYLLQSLGMPESIEKKLTNKTPKEISFDDYENLFTNKEHFEQIKVDNAIKKLISLPLDEMKKIVLAETLDEMKKIVLIETPQDKISWAYELFKMKGFDICMHQNMYEHITDPKVIEEIFHINHNSPDEQAYLLNIYIKNFKLDSLFEDLLHLHIQTLIKTYSQTKLLKKTKKYTIYESYEGGHLKFIQNLMSQNLSPYEKFKLASITCLFSNKELKNYYQTLASQISYEYLCSLRKAFITSYNKNKFQLPLSKHYNFHDYEKFVKLVEKSHAEHCKRNGMVQEWIKFMFVNGSLRDRQYFQWANNRQGINWNAYYNGEAYKNFPISPRAIFGPLNENGEQEIDGGKYPFFIIARQAQKSLKFKPELLYDDELYRQGFNHDIFKNPYPIDEKVLSKMQNNPYSFMKKEKNLKPETIYFIPQEDFPNAKTGVFVITKTSLKSGEINLYFVASLKDNALKLYNQGTPVSSPLKEEFLFNKDYSRNCIPKNMMWWYDLKDVDLKTKNLDQIYNTLLSMPEIYQTSKMFYFLKSLDPRLLHQNNLEAILTHFDNQNSFDNEFFGITNTEPAFENPLNNQEIFFTLSEEELELLLENFDSAEFNNIPPPEYFGNENTNDFELSAEDVDEILKNQEITEYEPNK